MSEYRDRTATRVRTKTGRPDVENALKQVELTREEEIVVRMRYGHTVSRSTPLEFRGQQDRELAVKLAMIEADALAEVRRPVAGIVESEDEALKRAIIKELREI